MRTASTGQVNRKVRKSTQVDEGPDFLIHGNRRTISQRLDEYDPAVLELVRSEVAAEQQRSRKSHRKLLARIPWNTASLRHEKRLVGSCGACGNVPGLGNRLHGSPTARVATAPDGRRCQHAEPDGSVCGADLSNQPTTAAPPGRLRRATVMAALAAGHRDRVAGV